ncbi:MAG: hypothetical protein KGJ86_05805 [Chloroflexota bacterium]|nr:hypothetical protein [Chloroflexota bacterium]
MAITADDDTTTEAPLPALTAKLVVLPPSTAVVTQRQAILTVLDVNGDAGVLKADSHAWNANKGHEERIGQLLILRGISLQVSVPRVPRPSQGHGAGARNLRTLATRPNAPLAAVIGS